MGKGNLVLDGEARVEAAKLLGLDRAPCARVDHLTESEQRTLRLAVNRLGEKGQWDIDGLKLEFEEVILADAPIAISGFPLNEIDQIILDVTLVVGEVGPLAPSRRQKRLRGEAICFCLGHTALSAAMQPTRASWPG